MYSSQYKENDSKCADGDNQAVEGLYYLDGFYRFILPPVTRWDSARFLTLAVDPWARYPNHWNDRNETTDDSNISIEQDRVLFHASEQSHAFLPFFPLCIRYVAKFLIFLLPRSVLPSTFEATVAFSAILINMTAFAIAAVALYELTLYLMLGELLLWEKRQQSLQKKEKGEPSTSIRGQECKTIAKMVAMAFCINPAGVFFTAAYSEAIFAMLNFTGYAIAAKGRYFAFKATFHPGDVSQNQAMLARWYPVPTNIVWALSSYTRSNGVIATTAWWCFIGLGTFCLRATSNTNARFISCITQFLYHLFMGMTIFIPVLYHDYRGYNFHCAQKSSIAPEWCDSTGRFSLYAYVQRKHWNVGLFRYYELKQIPNFILAAPVLVISFWAAVRWIRMSWNRHNAVTTTHILPIKIWGWVFEALKSSAVISSRGLVNKSNQFSLSSAENSAIDLLLGSTLLPYYAILYGFALIGSVLAHVQISTRLICSSCPAFYWFVVRLYLQNNNWWICKLSIQWWICFYFGLYNLLGVMMHVNWLPWT
jgi:phosphatidylinositol glycan class V